MELNEWIWQQFKALRDIVIILLHVGGSVALMRSAKKWLCTTNITPASVNSCNVDSI